MTRAELQWSQLDEEIRNEILFNDNWQEQFKTQDIEQEKKLCATYRKLRYRKVVSGHIINGDIELKKTHSVDTN